MVAFGPELKRGLLALELRSKYPDAGYIATISYPNRLQVLYRRQQDNISFCTVGCLLILSQLPLVEVGDAVRVYYFTIAPYPLDILIA